MNQYAKWALTFSVTGLFTASGSGCATDATVAQSANSHSAQRLTFADAAPAVPRTDTPRTVRVRPTGRAITGTSAEVLLPAKIAKDLLRRYPTHVVTPAPVKMTPDVAGSVIGFDFDPGPYRSFQPLERR